MSTPRITEEQRRLLDDRGYFLLEHVFTREEMDELAGQIERHQQRHLERLRERGGSEGISRAEEITFTAHLAEQDEAIRRFCTRQEFVSITTQLLGPDTDLYWNQSVFKQPEGVREFPWHQDDGYTPVIPSPYLTLWLALNDAIAENGCISVIPGSHQRGLASHERTPLGLVCHPADDPDQGVLVPVPAGSMAVFWSLTMHKSGANRTSETRKAFVIQYCHAGLRRADTGQVISGLIPVARNGASAEGCC